MSCGSFSINDLMNGFHYAMHGGGDYRGVTHSNSKEAYLFWKKRGAKIFEFDICHCADGGFVAFAHNLEKRYLYPVEVYDIPSKPTTEWFLNQKLYSTTTKGLTTVSLVFLINELKESKDIIFMLDLYGMFNKESVVDFLNSLQKLIGNDVSLYNRLLIEAYNIETSIIIMKRLSTACVIYGIHYEESDWVDTYGNRENGDNFDIVTPETLIQNGIRYVSYPWYYCKQRPGELEDFVRKGICVLSRTNSNKEYKKLKALGVSINLVDYKYDVLLFPIQRAKLVFYRWINSKRRKGV